MRLLEILWCTVGVWSTSGYTKRCAVTANAAALGRRRSHIPMREVIDTRSTVELINLV